jgi:hypothetical protein
MCLSSLVRFMQAPDSRHGLLALEQAYFPRFDRKKN